MQQGDESNYFSLFSYQRGRPTTDRPSPTLATRLNEEVRDYSRFNLKKRDPQKDDVVYIHVLDWKDSRLFVPFDSSVNSATLVRTGDAVPFETVDGGLVLAIPVTELREWVAVVKLRLRCNQ